MVPRPPESPVLVTMSADDNGDAALKIGSSSNEGEDEEEDPIAVFHEILQSPTPFASEEEEETCRKLLQALKEEDEEKGEELLVEQVAQVSYAYWYLSTQAAAGEREQLVSKEEVRDHMALKEIRRHLIGEKGCFKNALTAVREAMEYRKQYRITELRSCFTTTTTNNNNTSSNNNNNNNDTTTTKQLEESIMKEMKHQLLVVRGYSIEGGAVAYKHGRHCPTDETVEEEYIAANQYFAERVVAATEYATRGAGMHGSSNEKIVVAFDFDGYESKNAPPKPTIKKFAKVMQRVYPERLSTLVILHPPFWMKALYNLLYYFLSHDTRQKIQMATGCDSHIESVFEELVLPEQATPMIRPLKGQLTSPVDLNRYLYDVPFYRAYFDDDDNGN